MSCEMEIFNFSLHKSDNYLPKAHTKNNELPREMEIFNFSLHIWNNYPNSVDSYLVPRRMTRALVASDYQILPQFKTI